MIFKRKYCVLVIVLCVLVELQSLVIARERAFVTAVGRLKVSNNSFARLLSDTRAQLKLTQAEMAERMNLSQSYYSWFETGRTLPANTAIIETCCDLLNKSDYEMDKLLRAARAECSAQMHLALMELNNVDVEKLEHYVYRSKNYHKLVSEALLREGMTWPELLQHSGVADRYENLLLPTYRAQLESLSRILHTDYETLREAVMIDYLLRNYARLLRRHGELPLPPRILKALTQGYTQDTQMPILVAEKATDFSNVLRMTMKEQNYSSRKLTAALSLTSNKVLHWLINSSTPNNTEMQKLVEILHPTADDETLQQINTAWKRLANKTKARNSVNYSLRQLNLSWNDIAAYDISPITIISTALDRAGVGAVKFEKENGLGNTILYYYLRGKRNLSYTNLSIVHSELKITYDLAKMHKLLLIEKFAGVYQRNLKKFGEFLPANEHRTNLENVLHIRDQAVAAAK